MAKQQPVAREQSRSKRDKRQADPGQGTNGQEDEVARYEKELAGYLQQRIKPGLNSGAIPLLARSIAKDIAHREHPNGASDDAAEAKESGRVDDEQSAEAEEQASAEAEDEESAEAEDEDRAEGEDEQTAEADEDEGPEAEAEDDAEGDEVPDFEEEMHQVQAELGEDWILRFSVQGDDAWLTAEKDDGSQRLEAPTAEVLLDAVELLNEGGGRSS